MKQLFTLLLIVFSSQLFSQQYTCGTTDTPATLEARKKLQIDYQK